MATGKINHQVISASAGSGKTFQLAHRYIRLLADGVEPERIIALTFSRKAAGEIFDSIIKYLRLAASSEEGAQQTTEILEDNRILNDLSFLSMLKNILEKLHRLNISTIDSFNIGVVKAFPMELGIPASFQVMESDGALASSAQQEILTQIFNNRLVDRAAQNEFLEAFKQATYGQDEKGLTLKLDTFVSSFRQYYRLLPKQYQWGYQSAIWPEGSLWLQKPSDIHEVADKLNRLLDQDELDKTALTRWRAFIDAACDFTSHSVMSQDINYMAEKLLDDIDGLQHGKAHIKIGHKSYDLS